MQRVLITGSSRGIGAALALAYAREGADLLLVARDRERLSDVARGCTEAGGTARAIAVDVRDRNAMTRAIQGADEEGPIDIVVANAGLGGADALAGPLGEPAPRAQEIAEVNFIGVLNTITPAVPMMAARRRGRLAIMSSLIGMRGVPQAPIYSAAKAASRCYAEALRPLLRRHGISVSVVCPGYVDTEMSRGLPFAKPFMLTPEQAAARIKRGLERGSAHISFPWPLTLAARFGMLLPRPVADGLLARQHLAVLGRMK